jgi:hypothetical protein
MIGVNVPAFHYMPCCFTLVVNDLYFFNVSAEFLLARRMGFPYAESVRVRPDRLLEVVLAEGRQRTMHPILPLPFVHDGVEIYQPMFWDQLRSERRNFYEIPYVRPHALAWEYGIGRPTVVNGDVARVVLGDESVDVIPAMRHERHELHRRSMRQTLAVQASLWSYLYPGNKKFPAVRIAENLNHRWLSMGPEEWSSLAPDDQLKPI